jgi:hypothetical protein
MHRRRRCADGDEPAEALEGRLHARSLAVSSPASPRA